MISCISILLSAFFSYRHLLDLSASSEAFFTMLRHYIHDLHHGSLVNTADFLGLFFKTFPNISRLAAIPGTEARLKKIGQDWLDRPGMPEELEATYGGLNSGKLTLENNSLYADLFRETEQWRKFNNSKRKKNGGKVVFRRDLTSEQLVLLLESLLAESRVHARTMSELNSNFKLFPATRNAEVEHRWLELVVKFKFSRGKAGLRDFLVEHQAMGIYLYGEMAIFGWGDLARAIFAEIQPEMDESMAENVRQLITAAV